MLADTDDFVRDAVRSVLIHEQLLLIERCQDIQQIIDCLIKFDPLVPNETNDVADIPPDVLQLLPDAFPDRFLGSLLALGKIQEILPRLLAVCPRHSPSIFIADAPDHLFQQFSRVIQQLEILRKGYICWTASCIHDYCSLVRCSLGHLTII